MSGRLLNMNLGWEGQFHSSCVPLALCIHTSSPIAIIPTILATAIATRLSSLHPSTRPSVGLSTRHVTTHRSGWPVQTGMSPGGCRLALLGFSVP